MNTPSDVGVERRQQLELLRASATAFASKESPLSRARAQRGQAPGFDLSFWNALAAQGWTGLLAPESSGGFGQSLADMAEVTGALAAQIAPEPITPVVVFAGRLLQACGANELARQLLTEMAQGRSFPAVAWQEDATGAASFGAQGELADPATVCAVGTEALRLRGSKRHVRPGASATGWVVTASSSEGLALVWVPAHASGMQRRLDRLADGSFAARLDLYEVTVPSSHLLCRGSAARSALAKALDETLVVVSAELLAITRRMFEMTLEYLRTRKQFGKPIGSFQSLQHRAVDMLIQQELCAAAVSEGLAALDAGLAGDERARLAARVKARCSDAALAIARESVQMHGAVGFTDEYDLGLYLQRALVLSAWLGNAPVQRRRHALLARHADAAAGAHA